MIDRLCLPSNFNLQLSLTFSLLLAAAVARTAAACLWDRGWSLLWLHVCVVGTLCLCCHGDSSEYSGLSENMLRVIRVTRLRKVSV